MCVCVCVYVEVKDCYVQLYLKTWFDYDQLFFLYYKTMPVLIVLNLLNPNCLTVSVVLPVSTCALKSPSVVVFTLVLGIFQFC